MSKRLCDEDDVEVPKGKRSALTKALEGIQESLEGTLVDTSNIESSLDSIRDAIDSVANEVGSESPFERVRVTLYLRLYGEQIMVVVKPQSSGMLKCASSAIKWRATYAAGYKARWNVYFPMCDNKKLLEYSKGQRTKYKAHHTPVWVLGANETPAEFADLLRMASDNQGGPVLFELPREFKDKDREHRIVVFVKPDTAEVHAYRIS